jgi:SPP1 gp7 family putative phage head morphogenesis protein
MTLPAAFWDNEQRRLLAILVPRLAQMALTGMQEAARKVGIAFNNQLYNQQAEAWARAHADEILKGFIDSSKTMQGTFQAGTGQALADWIAKPGATVGELNESLTELFSQARASTIAVTEATRAFSSGQEIAYLNEGITEWTWQTNRDELVCPYCGGAHGQTRKIGDAFGIFRGTPVTKPPWHPNCRCSVKPKVNKD